jgi:hypothetical protein
MPPVKGGATKSIDAWGWEFGKWIWGRKDLEDMGREVKVQGLEARI